MAYPILMCGRICAGKSTVARALAAQTPAVILSCDELMISLGLQDAGEAHDRLARCAMNYLMDKSLDLLRLGVCVVLDFGFWSQAERTAADGFFRLAGFTPRWRYVNPDPAQWAQNVRARHVDAGRGEKVFDLDEGLLRKAELRFEPPTAAELADWAARG